MILLPFFLPVSASCLARMDTVLVPTDLPPAFGTLNAAVQTAIQGGALSRTVFVLEQYGYYILPEKITVPEGERLTIIAAEPGRTQLTAPPQILLANTYLPTDTLINFDCFGDIVLKNVWVLYVNVSGEQVGGSLQIEDRPDSVNGQNGSFDGVIFDYSAIPWSSGGAVTVTSRHFRGSFRNCYFRNCTDRHFRYYGRAVSFPYASGGWHIDSLLFENCTFGNIGYVYMQEGGEYADVVLFNHCTFVNVVMFPLESGWWHKAAVTNSIFSNTHMFGDIPAHGSREPYGGTMRIDSVSRFGFAVPFTDSDRRILFAHNSYFVEEWLQDWMYNNPSSVEHRAQGRGDQVPVPQPMLSPRTLRFLDATENGQKVFPYMNRAHLYDSTDPGFNVTPTNLIGLRTFLYMKWFCCSDTVWSYHPEQSVHQEWPLKEDLAYTNPTLLTAGMGGFPLGDLYRWFPQYHVQWRYQEAHEQARIVNWMSTGTDPGDVNDLRAQSGNAAPSGFELGQNYPNPFNATTHIAYTIPDGKYVSLKVFDLLGKEVSALHEGRKEGGSHVATFDGTGHASGVYLYRLQAEGYIATRKLVLLKLPKGLGTVYSRLRNQRCCRV